MSIAFRGLSPGSARFLPRVVLSVLLASGLWGRLAPPALAFQAAVESSADAASPPPGPGDLPLDPRIDPQSGSRIATWRPETWFDHRHMRLELDFPDLSRPFLTGRQILTSEAVGQARDRMRLDAKQLEIRSVTVGRRAASFVYLGSDLVITLPAPVPVGEQVETVIEYEVDFGSNKGQGLTWSPPIPGAESLSDQFPQVHSQGQPQDNSRWFVCHDFPNDKLTTELVVTVEDGYEVSSNGRLVSRDPAGPGRVRWHWLQDKPHSAYLVTLVIGKFSIVELGGADSARPGLAMPLYVPIGFEDDARRLYRRTAEMVAFFEQLFDEPYPWDRYAQLICRDFAWGGMENTGATTMTRASLVGEDGSQDDLIAHELAHQWFGNLVTCKGWEHLWLNEGWASFSEALWAEHAAGENPAERRRAYQRTIASYFSAQRATNSSFAPEYPPLVSNRYRHEAQVMGKPDDVYGKGAIVLHMLRMRLGDEVFFRGARLFLDRFGFRHATTDDFRRCLEDVSGQSLDRFFTQWTLRPGLPRLDVAYTYDAGARELSVRLGQTQRVDRDNPAYAFSLPLVLRFDDGPNQTVYVDMDSLVAVGRFAVHGRPATITVDPRMTVAAPHRVVKELDDDEPAPVDPD
ncbi:MAG: M1 family metallopeptidase [Phycisphaeraceae bacterium]|nr:M1 family metallopeptidase [Phycisphaerae bacterium]MBX3391551.1 M1 family metallopeptidase [Phycisphaeraceae bacterium]HRJ49019.1 M1 family metallopeptidase [Phycisphaerales bacterium]